MPPTDPKVACEDIRYGRELPAVRDSRLPGIAGFAIALVALLLPAGTEAVDLFVPAESFETDGDNGVRYLSNTHTDGSGDYFERHNFGVQNPHPGQGQVIVP